MIRLENMDCIEYLRGLPDRSIDLTLTDPPYGIRADSKKSSGFGRTQGSKYKGDWDKEIPSKEYFDEIIRVSRKCIIFGGNYFAHLLPPSRGWLVWDKKGNIRADNNFSDCELIYTSFDIVCKKITFMQAGRFSDTKDERVHPTQKPTELIDKLLDMFSRPDDTILDCFMGSGSTGISCVRKGLNFIGIEKDKHYYEIAKQRINREMTMRW